jgi:hypothetical protein
MDRVRLERALRGFIAHVDYDIHKSYECGEEDGEDHYSDLVDLFLEEWEAADGL